MPQGEDLRVTPKAIRLMKRIVELERRQRRCGGKIAEEVRTPFATDVLEMEELFATFA